MKKTTVFVNVLLFCKRKNTNRHKILKTKLWFY